LKTRNPKTGRDLGFATLAAMGLLLSACSYDSAELRDYVAEVKSRPGGKFERIPPPPDPSPVPEVSQKVDPFRSFLTEELAKAAQPLDPPELPWPPHNPEELERYPLDALRMVGTLDQQSEQWGLIRDPDGVIHRVKAGNYMGRNYGKILEVSEHRIHLLEKVSDGRGQWQERDAEVSLSE
jgi:type IV pilus assembly protein PilP